MAKTVAKKKTAPKRVVPKAGVARRKLKPVAAKAAKAKAAPKAKIVVEPKAKVVLGPSTERMLALLKGRTGATVAEIAKANSWLPHTTRAAISVTRRKLGLDVTKTVEEGRGLVYKVEA